MLNYIKAAKRRLNSKLGAAKTTISYLPKSFRLIWLASKNWTVLWLILLIFQGILPGLVVYLTKSVVNSLTEAIKLGYSEASIKLILFPGMLMVGALILTELLQGLSTWVRSVQSELLQDYTAGLIHEKSISVDLAFYELSEYYDKQERARYEASSRSLALLDNTGSLLQNSITLIAIAGILIPYALWLPFALVLAMLPALLVVMYSNKEYYDWSQKTTTDRRKIQYYEYLLMLNNFAAEIRLFDLGKHYKSAFQSLRKTLREQRLRLLRNQGMYRILASAFSLLIALVIMAWMGIKTLQGLFSLGDLALLYQAFNRGQTLAKTLLNNVGQIYNSSLFIGNLFEFLLIEPQIVDPPWPVEVPSPITKGISFENVAFSYPGSDRSILKNFNFFIPAGKVVAIVGDNGAGKSTLVKLLCRFYDPASGNVKLDGIDFRDFKVQDLRNLITVLFQTHSPYQETVKNNIILGDIKSQPTEAEIEKAAEAAGAIEVIKKLPRGYDTLLGKWFSGGTELSGGEWQRIALARAFLRRAQIIILDEPTSAMDSWAEADWLDRFRELANGRTAVVITHRFTLAMRADIIHVMRNGEIVESGNHYQLVNQKGFYAQSWEKQTESYMPEDEDNAVNYF
jgi:ATP-binding cassette, subfamily B, bacterial